MNIRETLERINRRHLAPEPEVNKLIGTNGYNRRGAPYPYVGEKFGEWTVTGASRKSDIHGRMVMPVICSCSTEGEAIIANLRAGRTKRCLGCGSAKARAARRFGS